LLAALRSDFQFKPQRWRPLRDAHFPDSLLPAKHPEHEALCQIRQNRAQAIIFYTPVPEYL
jgi:hypothetical protein